MSYNTRNNYNTRHSGQGGGRQGNYNTSGQFVPATSNGQAAGADRNCTPLQQRPPRTNSTTLTQTNGYAQMYNSSAPNEQSMNYQPQEEDVDMKVEPSAGGEFPPAAAETPAWMKSKLQGVKKVSNKERRRRQNETLRRLLSPKNAVMVLNEVMPEQQIANNIRVEQAPASFYGAQTFAAEVTVDGQSFKGYGENKLAARTKAAEQAFRELMIKRMTKLVNQDASSVNGAGEEEDDSGTLPMLQLASFALHKLFAEWEGEGHKVPALRPPAPQQSGGGGGGGGEVGAGAGGAGAAGGGAGGAPPSARALPHNAAEMHPCMLLTYMCPRAEYREVCSSGAPPNCSFTVAVGALGRTHSATAKSKKEARRLAAKAACEELYNVQFQPNPVAATPITAPVV